MSRFSSKKTLSDVQSEIYLVQFYALSNVTSFLLDNLSGIKKIIFRPGFGTHWVKGTVEENRH